MNHRRVTPTGQAFINEEISRLSTKTPIMSTAIAINIAGSLSMPPAVDNIESHYANNVGPTALLLLDKYLDTMPINTSEVAALIKSFYIWRYRVSIGHIVELAPAKKKDNVLPNSIGLSHVLPPEAIDAMNEHSFKNYYRGTADLLRSFMEAAR